MDEQYLELAERSSREAIENELVRASLAMEPQKHVDFDGTHCVDCEQEIPQGRLVLGRVRCVYCQELLERKQKGTV